MARDAGDGSGGAATHRCDYGNAAGCGVAAGDVAESEDMLVLTPRDAATYGMHCSLVQSLLAAT